MKLVRIGICALVVFGIAAHGGVEDWARAVLETGAGWLLVLWSLFFLFAPEDERELIVTPLLPPLVLLACLALGQLLLHRSASNYGTHMELNLLVADCIALFLAAQSLRTASDWRGFVWFVMFFGFLVAVFGILQHLTFNGKLYWFREMRYGGIPFGPYVNRNHFAGLMELVIPVSLVPLILGKVRRERWVVVALFALIPMGALFLSASRGGIISLGVEIGILLLIMALRGTGGKHVLVAGVVLLLAVLFVSWLGVRQVLDRFSSLQSLETTSGKRASMRQDSWRIFLDHPWTGSGLGTLQIVYPAYETLYDGKIVNHAHNDYVEALAETGAAGAICCAAFLGVLFYVSLRRLLVFDGSFAAALHLSGLVACSGFLVHSLVDFNLRIPANAMVFFLLAYLATGDVRTSAAPSSFGGNDGKE
jgi:O-antigen ligase